MNKRKGFTLVELLIGLVLFALIMGTVLGSLHTASRSWHKVNQFTDATERLRVTHRLLRRLISEAVPLVWMDKDEPARLLFAGGDDTFEFVGQLPAHQGVGGLYTLKLDVSDGELNLTYSLLHTEREAPILSDDPNATTVRILGDVSAIEFAYYGAKSAEDPMDWHDDWEEQDTSPLLVRISVINDPTQTDWPELVVPIHVKVTKGKPQFIIKAALDE